MLKIRPKQLLYYLTLLQSLLPAPTGAPRADFFKFRQKRFLIVKCVLNDNLPKLIFFVPDAAAVKLERLSVTCFYASPMFVSVSGALGAWDRIHNTSFSF